MEPSDEAPPLVSELLAAKLGDLGLSGYQGVLCSAGLQTMSFLGKAGSDTVEEVCAAAKLGAGHKERFAQLRKDAVVRVSGCTESQRCDSTASTSPDMTCIQSEEGCQTTASSEHRDLLWHHCQEIRNDHTPNKKDAARIEISQKLSGSVSEVQMVQWIQEFNYKLLEKSVTEGSSGSHVFARGDGIDVIAAALLKPNNGRAISFTRMLQDIFVAECCLTAGVSDEQRLLKVCMFHLKNALGSWDKMSAVDQDFWWNEQSSKCLQSLHISIGFLPGAFASNTSAVALRRGIRRPKKSKTARTTHSVAAAAASRFVPLELPCSPSWQVQADALFGVLVAGSDSEQCSSCAWSLQDHLNVLHWARVPEEMAFKLKDTFVREVAMSMSRFPDDEKFQTDAIATLLNFCRNANICLGLVVSRQSNSVSSVSVDTMSKVSEVVEQELARNRNDISDDCYRLLGRTQPFSAVRDFMSKNQADLMHEVFSEVFDGFRNHLLDCDSTKTRHCSEESRHFARKILSEVSKQRIVGCSQPNPISYEAMRWVSRDFKFVEQRLRILLVGLLCPLREEILVPLTTTKDETVIRAGYQAISDLWVFTEASMQQQLLWCSFNMLHTFSENTECARMTTWAVSLQGVATRSPECSERVIKEVVETTERWLYTWHEDPRDSRRLLETFEGSRDGEVLMHVALWTLEEFFSGAQDFGAWEDLICPLAEKVLKDFTESSSPSASGAIDCARNLLCKRQPKPSRPSRP